MMQTFWGIKGRQMSLVGDESKNKNISLREWTFYWLELGKKKGCLMPSSAAKRISFSSPQLQISKSRSESGLPARSSSQSACAVLRFTQVI